MNEVSRELIKIGNLDVFPAINLRLCLVETGAQLGQRSRALALFPKRQRFPDYIFGALEAARF